MTDFTDQIKGESFIVTGGAGFIGSSLVDYLLSNEAARVRVLDNLSTGKAENINGFISNKRFEYVEGDIRNLETCKKAVKGMSYVLHEAALGSVPRSLNDPATTNDVNVGGFLNMLIASRDEQVKRFVYAASSSTYGNTEVFPMVESKIGKPLSPYAVTKYVNELYAHVFNLNYGLDTIGLRYFNVYGPKQDPNGTYAAVIPRFISAVLQNESPLVYGNGEQTRDFTYVGNVIHANIQALFIGNSESLNQVYNVAVGESTSLNNLLQMICEITGKACNPVYRQSRKGDIRNSLADISKARELLGYEPKVKIREGIEKTINSFRTQEA